jgi:NhaP-type Na+/H+ or K+/H+ antiporter
MTPDLQVALAIAFLMGLILGFAVGYGVRAFISHRRHVAARRRSF